MDQNFFGSLLHVARKLKEEPFLGNTDVGYSFVSQGSEFTEPVLGVAFLITLVKQFTLCDVLADFPANLRSA